MITESKNNWRKLMKFNFIKFTTIFAVLIFGSQAHAQTSDDIEFPVEHEITALANVAITITESDISSSGDVQKQLASVCVTTNRTNGLVPVLFTADATTGQNLVLLTDDTVTIPYTLQYKDNSGNNQATLTSGSSSLVSAVTNDFVNHSSGCNSEGLFFTITNDDMKDAQAGTYNITYTFAEGTE